MSAKESLLTSECLKSRLRYYPASGNFYWIAGQTRGCLAGNLMSRGHRNITVNGRGYYAHRLAWLYMRGEWPPDMIDHANGNPDDNSFANIRPCNRAFNQQNQRTAQRTNKSGYLGVSPFRGKYKATIRADGKRYDLGVYADPAVAHEAYLRAKRELHKGCTI